MARAYAHKLATKMQRENLDEYEEVVAVEIVEHPTLGRCFIGNFILGLGLFNVHFPADAVRPATEAEIAQLTSHTYGGCGQRFRLKREEFATQAELDEMPVVAVHTVA